MLKRFLFLTILLALFVSLSNFAFAAGPPKMFWLEPHIGDPCYLNLKIETDDLKITSLDIAFTLTSTDLNGISVDCHNPNNILAIETRLNTKEIFTLSVTGISKNLIESSTLLTVNLNNQKGDINAIFNKAEVNGGPSEKGGLDVLDRAIGGKISFSPLQINFNGSTVSESYFGINMGQKLILTATGGIPPYKWGPVQVSPIITLYEIRISEDKTTVEIVPNNWAYCDTDRLSFIVTVTDAQNKTTKTTIDLFVLLGDVDFDGLITIGDAQTLLHSIVDPYSPLTRPQRIAAEVSGNGTITTADAVLILQYSVGLISEFPATGGAGDGIGAPSAKQPLIKQLLSFSRQIKELKQKGVDSETLDLLVLAKQQETKGKHPTTWGKIKG